MELIYVERDKVSLNGKYILEIMAPKAVSLSMLQRKHQSLKFSAKMSEGKQYAFISPIRHFNKEHLLLLEVGYCVVWNSFQYYAEFASV